MTRRNIILTGFMGCGKTTVGRMLAEKLDYDFIDTDNLIEKRSGMTIQEIFAIKGEKSFREMESNIARELGVREGLIISTGGGMMLNLKNISALGTNGQVFCLVATPEEILERISSDKNGNRPLLDAKKPLERIVELMRYRQKYYRQFTQISTSGKTPEEITRHLITIYQSQQE